MNIVERLFVSIMFLGLAYFVTNEELRHSAV
jgi:hypothetical protein